MSGTSLGNLWLLAASTPGGERVVYELARLRDASDPRLLVTLIAAAAAALLMTVGLLYRRDTRELAVGARLVLLTLRCVALGGLLVYFLGLEKRTTREMVTDSQVVVLADVSQSMGLSDGDSSGVPADPARWEKIASVLTDSPLLDDLRMRHQVIVARFDRDVDRLATLEIQPSETHESMAESAPVLEGATEEAPNWKELLLPRGTETRIGDAIGGEVGEFRDGPLAGIVVVSDGVENAGREAAAAAQQAADNGVPIFTIGVGSTDPPRSIAVADLVAPQRAYPDDTMTLTAYLQSFGFAGRVVQVQLLRREAAAPNAPAVVVGSERVVLAKDGEAVTTEFAVEPTETGRFVYEVAAAGLPGDTNRQDNRRAAEVDVVDRQTSVLLMAGGPSRDYRFLRTLLYRDTSMHVDVLLQSAGKGISQEADRILDAFPATKQELYDYDCIVAIDPDWTQLDAAQVELLEAWVANEAGGMIVVAGPVHTARWTRSTEHAPLKALYPVEFQKRLTLLDDGHFAGETAWPIEFERAGREASFLWLEDSAEASALAWEQLRGVFGYYAVKGPKLGATVYGRFSDPEAGFSGEQPVYFAGHFYGSGRVFYAGSSEFWRLRRVDPAYFDVLYTKLIRHVSQGRLLRGSSFGALMVERDRYELGETVIVRARLTDEQHEPLAAPSVAAQVLRPDAVTEPLELTADANQPGMFVGQFAAMQEGAYRVAVALPSQPQRQLSKQVQVRAADRERLNPQRNETLLAQLAELSGGKYFAELSTAVFGAAGTEPLAEAIPDRTETRLIESGPDEDFARRQSGLLLGVIAGCLFVEWTIRRLLRLA